MCLTTLNLLTLIEMTPHPVISYHFARFPWLVPAHMAQSTQPTAVSPPPINL